MIYQTTYLSDGLRVKGFLGLPYGRHLPQPELRRLLNRYYGTEDLSAAEVAVPVRKNLLDVRDRRWPVLVYCRGGIGHVGRVQTHWLEKFSRHGRLVFAPSYRGSESGAGRDEFGGRDTEDVLSAIRWLESLPFADPERIAVLGFSRGSVNAVRAAVESDKVRKLAVWGGVSDLARTYEERPDLRKMLKRVVGGSPAKAPEAYAARSPLAMADRIGCPVLVIHGTEDAQVDFSHGTSFYERLKQLGKDADRHFYEGLGHHLPDEIHEAAVDRMFHWIDH
ncbi:alpha/beta hydrolase family protein [Cohnella caldifontis]|uniref:alpha/beta hydrolase family protein n=1 Tax=Cohnella caldifontis TaxID=3027471 RepID=UPI0023EBAF12|nr:prolyl oligopeptidase family serine peptidase [Cohnella sp. YIM B05605]